MARNWQGYFVCPEHNEPRQPQDFVRAVPDEQIVPWSQKTPASIWNYVKTPTFPYLGDGVNLQFQSGDGLYQTSVTAVFVHGTQVFNWTANADGLITFTTGQPPARFATVTSSGTEIVQT
jgi:hypothetical protein